MAPKKLIASIFGNALEFYDFTLYIFLTPIIAPLFFPSQDPVVSLLASLGAFAVSFLMRPLGGLFFGYLGDKYGRKLALSLSILMMAVPTGLIGFLPAYEEIGVLAPVILIVLRMLQGLCTGGEYSGAGIFAVENAPKGKAGFFGAFITSSSMVGCLMGSLIGYLVSLPIMPAWAWRAAFLAGALVGFIGFYIRRHVEENAEVLKEIEKAQNKLPLAAAFKKAPRAVFTTFFLASFAGILFYSSFSYISLYLTTYQGVPLFKALLITSLGMFGYILVAPISGRIADKVGQRRVILSGTIATIIMAYPIFLILKNAHVLSLMILGQLLLSLVSAWSQGPLNVYFAQLFPIEARYSGLAFGYTMGQAVFGGTASLVLISLMKWTGSQEIVALYIIFGAFLGLLGLWLAPRETR